MTGTAKASIAIVGYGAIGRYTVAAMAGDTGCRVGAVIVRPARVAETQATLGLAIQVTDSIASLAEPPDLIVVSVGALADRALLAELERAAREGGGTAEIAPGAIGGIDALAAARQGGLERVAYTSRKPPPAWKGTPGEALCDLDRLDAPFTLFEGPADEAARTYPKNANVAATVALAGAGFDRTAVRIVADPGAPGNVHEIEAIGEFGRMALRMEGKPLPDNPKTSSLTAFSVLRAIRNEGAAVRI